MSGDTMMLGTASTPAGCWVDARYFLENFGTDDAAREELVALFLRVSEQQMDALGSARAASDWQRIAREAHGLKGSLGLFGARETIQLLERLEQACEDEASAQIAGCLDELGRCMAHVAAAVSALSSVSVEA